MKKALLCSVILSLCLIAQDKTGGLYLGTAPSTGTVAMYADAPSHSMVFLMNGTSGPSLKISADGTITFGKDAKVSEVAKEFAAFLKQYMACPTSEKH